MIFLNVLPLHDARVVRVRVTADVWNPPWWPCSFASDIIASATSDAGNGSIGDLANRDALVGGRERRLPLLFRFRFMATNSFGLILFPSYACEQPGRSVVTATTNSRTEVHLYLPAARQQKLEVLPQTPRETQCRSLIPFQSSATAKSFV